MPNFGGIATFGALTGSNLKPSGDFGGRSDSGRSSYSGGGGSGYNDRKRGHDNNRPDFGNAGIKSFGQVTGARGGGSDRYDNKRGRFDGQSTRGMDTVDRSGGSYGSRDARNGASGDRSGNGPIWGRNDMGLNQNNRAFATPRRNSQPSTSNNVVDLTGPATNKPPANFATDMKPPNFGSMGASRPNNPPVIYGGNAPMSRPTVPPNWSNSSSVPPSSKLNHSIKNPIGHINEMAAKSAQKLPDFKLTSSGGPSHKPIFEMECRYQGKVVKAVASNKKDVKHNAAVLMLQQMGM